MNFTITLIDQRISNGCTNATHPYHHRFTRHALLPKIGSNESAPMTDCGTHR
jgi:hypothetical protein